MATVGEDGGGGVKRDARRLQDDHPACATAGPAPVGCAAGAACTGRVDNGVVVDHELGGIGNDPDDAASGPAADEAIVGSTAGAAVTAACSATAAGEGIADDGATAVAVGGGGASVIAALSAELGRVAAATFAKTSRQRACQAAAGR
ncbi:MAG: hypothetical protein E6J90_07195 [Deltaproteobacteria bacterium]|nr:MAG: hypothetical protein E6J90_07195 [Deltaproteobacteria bacterium]